MKHVDRGSRLAGMALAALVVLASRDASALSIADVSPLYFRGPSGFGFLAADVAAAGFAPSFTASPSDDWVSAGSGGQALSIAQRLVAIHQNPQRAGRTPSPADPWIVDSLWTVRNDSGRDLPSGLLVFTQGDAIERYPGVPVALDGDLLSILDYSAGGVDYFFGAAVLPSLGEGQSVDVLVRYVAGGLLDYDAGRNAYVLPTLGLYGLVAPIPEPGTAIALALGLVALGAGARAVRRAGGRAPSS